MNKAVMPKQKIMWWLNEYYLMTVLLCVLSYYKNKFSALLKQSKQENVDLKHLTSKWDLDLGGSDIIVALCILI